MAAAALKAIAAAAPYLSAANAGLGLVDKFTEGGSSDIGLDLVEGVFGTNPEPIVPSAGSSTCGPLDCYQQCREQDRQMDAQCKMLNDEYIKRMEGMGCPGTKCKTPKRGKTCKKKKVKKARKTSSKRKTKRKMVCSGGVCTLS